MARPTRDDVVHDQAQGRRLVEGIFDGSSSGEHHDRPVVDGVVERGASQHQPVQQCHGHGQLGSRRGRFQDVISGGPVEQEAVAVAPVGGRDHPYRPLDETGGMADEAFVQNPVHQVPVVVTSFPVAAERSAVRGRERFADHGASRRGPGRHQAMATRSKRSSLHWSSVPSGINRTRSGASSVTNPHRD